MREKHTIEDRLRYMNLIEEGYSINHIHKHYGINKGLLNNLWIRYQQEGPLALMKKKNVKADGFFKEKIIRDIEKNC